MTDLAKEALLALNEEERKEVYIEWLLNRGIAAALKKKTAQFSAHMILERFADLWSLDKVIIETWESEAALRMMKFVEGCEKNGRGQ